MKFPSATQSFLRVSVLWYNENQVSSKLSLWRWVNGPQCTQPNKKEHPQQSLEMDWLMEENLKLPGSTQWSVLLIFQVQVAYLYDLFQFSSLKGFDPSSVSSLSPPMCWVSVQSDLYFLDWMNYLPRLLTFTVITTKHGALKLAVIINYQHRLRQKEGWQVVFFHSILASNLAN